MKICLDNKKKTTHNAVPDAHKEKREPIETRPFQKQFRPPPESSRFPIRLRLNSILQSISNEKKNPITK